MFPRIFGTAAKDTLSAADRALLTALQTAQAIIWFDLDGHIQGANDNFLAIMGYRRDDILGKHHRIFATPGTAESAAYQRFWSELRAGQRQHDTYPRLTKTGNTVWLEASYNPLLNAAGQPVGVVKFATDVTAAKLRALDTAGQIAAISTSQATIEFDLTGKILTVNDNFCAATDYSAAELIGQHHAIFMDKDEAASPGYRQFWHDLAQGKFKSGAFRRLTKSGKDCWLQASYNPIFDADGKPCKVVKFASDITAQKEFAADALGKIAAMSKIQAIIEFDLNGNILTANDNFCKTMGYSLSEVQGRHHSMFVDPELAASPAYSAFWQDLARGTPSVAEFKRYTKSGTEIWLRASYNPILDANGRPCKVVKFASQTERSAALDVLKGALERLSSGDLQVRIEDKFDSEFEVIRADFNNATSKLDRLIAQVIDHARTIGHETSEIGAATDDLSRRAEQQAATLEQTAAAIDELTASVKAASSVANEGSTMVDNARKSASHSGVVVRDAVQAMDEISESSSKISKITSVIDEIAFQTNLLALNAGVEAARAGEAGRGFAVVASEVRALAQRSSDAAREIADLISASANQVKRGVGLVGQAGAALSEIDGAVTQIHERVSTMANSSREQSAGLAEINMAVNQLDQVTQHNAAMFEETNAATRNLTIETKELTHKVSQFQYTGQSYGQPIVGSATYETAGKVRRAS
ncbi:methyl-accepting chemotaxis protein [Phaeovulum sp. W22_SRMD_FR3]|uniref:methyl-accepting chemotaxis protein n=1 Tax=Phaeovulum sp. W22_SRMD_FR3 TaxID=3240274 RepID=UPI003F9C055D